MANPYGIIAEHSPSTCPSANRAVRDTMLSGMADLPSLLGAHGISLLSAEHFDPEHLLIFRLEAASVEDVRDFVNASGLLQWNNCRIYPLTALEELAQRTSELFPNTLF